jgi:hypothetical protein
MNCMCVFLNYILPFIILTLVIRKYYKNNKDIKIIKTNSKSNTPASSNNTKENMMSLSLLDKLELPKKMEITSQEPVCLEMFFRYGNNNNHLYNDGRAIWQSTIKFLENRVIINGERYGLSRLEWHKSVLSWQDKDVGLELHLVHSMVEVGNTIVFVIPLSLVDMRRESFVDLGHSNQPTDVSTINSLITKVDQIPSYVCCSPNQGHMVNFNLCPVANLLLQQKKFYKKEMSNTVTWFITEPQPFDRYIGLNIRSKLVG